MSLDNVLAVAGAAKGSLAILIAGLVFSIVLMAAAATLVAKLLMRHSWIAWLGLAIIPAVVATRSGAVYSSSIWRGVT